MQAADSLLRENDTERIANLADFEFEHVLPFDVITTVATRLATHKGCSVGCLVAEWLARSGLVGTKKREGTSVPVPEARLGTVLRRPRSWYIRTF